VRALQQLGVSAARACLLVGFTRSNLYYRRKPKDDAALQARLQDLAAKRPRWGWRRLLILLERERVEAGEHRVRRVYRELGLQVRARKKRKVRYVRGNTIAPVSAPNERWSLDFMHDTLASGRRLRTLMVIDDFTRECLAIEIERGFSSRRVIRALEAIAFARHLHFIDPGKPVQNAHIESFNGRARDEFLNLHSFLTLDQARESAAAWLIDYNEIRPHSSIGNRTPKEFADSLQISQPSQPSAA
jgi:putative transposase